MSSQLQQNVYIVGANIDKSADFNRNVYKIFTKIDEDSIQPYRNKYEFI